MGPGFSFRNAGSSSSECSDTLLNHYYYYYYYYSNAVCNYNASKLCTTRFHMARLAHTVYTLASGLLIALVGRLSP